MPSGYPTSAQEVHGPVGTTQYVMPNTPLAVGYNKIRYRDGWYRKRGTPVKQAVAFRCKARNLLRFKGFLRDSEPRIGLLGI